MTSYEYLTDKFNDPRPLQDYLNIMGGLRWELCAAYYEHQTLCLIFKRAIDPDRLIK